MLELNAAFPEACSKKDAALQCRAVVLNVNLGYNTDIMKRCRKLAEYARFIATIREYLEQGDSIEESVNHAVDACIEQGILEQILRDNRGEVCAMILTEYDEQGHLEDERAIAREEGREEGEARFAILLQHLIDNGRGNEVEKVLTDLEYRKKLYAEYNL